MNSLARSSHIWSLTPKSSLSNVEDDPWTTIRDPNRSIDIRLTQLVEKTRTAPDQVLSFIVSELESSPSSTLDWRVALVSATYGIKAIDPKLRRSLANALLRMARELHARPEERWVTAVGGTLRRYASLTGLDGLSVLPDFLTDDDIPHIALVALGCVEAICVPLVPQPTTITLLSDRVVAIAKQFTHSMLLRIALNGALAVGAICALAALNEDQSVFLCERVIATGDEVVRRRLRHRLSDLIAAQEEHNGATEAGVRALAVLGD